MICILLKDFKNHHFNSHLGLTYISVHDTTKRKINSAKFYHFQSRLYFQCFKPNLEVHRASFPVISQANDNEISPGTRIRGSRSRRFWTSTRCRSWTWLASGCTNHSLGSSWSWPGSLTRASISCSNSWLSWPRKWPRDLCPISGCPDDKLGPCLGRIRQLVTSCSNHNLEKV